ncbi:unnamed protein product, partial [Ranitomeya imitator]
MPTTLPCVEIRYEIYNPLIQEIQVLKLEKRVDDALFYLRDALPEYSTVDVNMKPVVCLEREVPVNQVRSIGSRGMEHVSSARGNVWDDLLV